MASIEVGRVCVKTAGREAGEKCVIIELIDENFVEVVGGSVKNRRCNINHLEPLEATIEVSDDIEAVKKEVDSVVIAKPEPVEEPVEETPEVDEEEAVEEESEEETPEAVEEEAEEEEETSDDEAIKED